jgi:hypothetical protein
MAETLERTCPNCNLPRRQWKGNGGHGYVMRGQTYCCRGCAENGPGTPLPATPASAPAGTPAGATGCTCL